MKKALFALAAAFALTLGSAAYAQSSPSPMSDKAPPSGSDTTTTGTPSEGNKPDAAKKTAKNKPGSDATGDTAGSGKSDLTK